MRYLIKFSYDGSNFYGYQKQPNIRTIEGELEKALFNINNHTYTKIVSSGRTDRGVHALSQTAHFDLDVDITLYKLKCALNSLLPSDIHVFSTEIVDSNFHARFNVVEKTYVYKINLGEYSPIHRNYIFQYNKDLDIDKMNNAIQHFLGTHNFKPFVSDEVVKHSFERTISNVSIEKVKDILTISFTGNGFMKYQVRNMVGTLIKIGQGKLDENIIDLIFSDPNYSKHVLTAKSEGLYLDEVFY